MSQSEFEAMKRNQRKARESGTRFPGQSQSEAM